ncbi:MAG TPA: serine O-acetyltransferase [Clostridiales bacterium]|jgi:serine O-acetyltransferase|nr:serine O-acetyltransferase [Clostridiales bacterium]
MTALGEFIRSIKARDPAAKNAAQVLLLYSGVHALVFYRIAHFFYKIHWYFIARWISQLGRFFTGIEIHPGAKIGKCLFIDHGMGVIIGETTEIGNYCTIYQGVTLGGTGKDTGKRHPTLGNNVMVGAGAKILGPFKVGDNAKIAAGAVVLSEVPPNTTAVGIPARIVNKKAVAERCADLDHVHIPDPVSQELCKLYNRIAALEQKVAALEGGEDAGGAPDTKVQ